MRSSHKYIDDSRFSEVSATFEIILLNKDSKGSDDSVELNIHDLVVNVTIIYR